jgi:hypothetical protein
VYIRDIPRYPTSAAANATVQTLVRCNLALTCPK